MFGLSGKVVGCPEKFLDFKTLPNLSHSNICRANVAVAKVLLTSSLHMLLWPRFGKVFNSKNISGHSKTVPGNPKTQRNKPNSSKNAKTFESPNTFRGGFWINTESKHVRGKCLGTQRFLRFLKFLIFVLVLAFLGQVFGYPEQFLDLKTLPTLCHGNICRDDVNRTLATATCAEPMCTEP